MIEYENGRKEIFTKQAHNNFYENNREPVEGIVPGMK